MIFVILSSLFSVLFAVAFGITLRLYLKTKQALFDAHMDHHDLLSKRDLEQQYMKDKEILLQQSQKQFQGLLESIAQKALISNNESFLTLAKSAFSDLQEKAKMDMEQKHVKISALLEPLQKSLEKVDLKMDTLEKERAHAYGDLKRQVIDMMMAQKELRLETANLVKALRTPIGRGQWGEMQLKRVIEMAGMVSHCDFVEQVSVADNRLRPDVVVRLPGNKMIVVDAKTPLAAYLDSLECTDDARKAQLIQDHARHVRTHISSLSKRHYFEQFENSPEFVVMFLPGESIFSIALEADPSLIEYGVQEKVIMATPTTLIALLRAVAYGWQQEAVAENARQIAQLGRDFYKRLVDFSSHLSRMGKSLGQAVGAYNEGIGTFEKRVMVSARRFKELDPGLDQSDAQLAELDATTRHLVHEGKDRPQLQENHEVDDKMDSDQ